MPIADTFAGFLDVSADGRRLLFFASDPQNQFKLIVCDLPTCTNRVSLLLPSNYAPVMQRFMPGGRGIAYVDLTLSNLWSLPLDGGAPRQLTNFKDRRIANFAWSRDGKRLAIMRTINTNDVVLFKGLKE